MKKRKLLTNQLIYLLAVLLIVGLACSKDEEATLRGKIKVEVSGFQNYPDDTVFFRVYTEAGGVKTIIGGGMSVIADPEGNMDAYAMSISADDFSAVEHKFPFGTYKLDMYVDVDGSTSDYTNVTALEPNTGDFAFSGETVLVDTTEVVKEFDFNDFTAIP